MASETYPWSFIKINCFSIVSADAFIKRTNHRYKTWVQYHAQKCFMGPGVNGKCLTTWLDLEKSLRESRGKKLLYLWFLGGVFEAWKWSISYFSPSQSALTIPVQFQAGWLQGKIMLWHIMFRSKVKVIFIKDIDTKMTRVWYLSTKTMYW